MDTTADKEASVDVRIGRAVVSWRRRADLTQVQLGRQIGVTRDTLRLWEHGTRSIPARALHAIARAVGASPATLIRGRAAM
jgi:transcriptional regulator with XRE-family HTH domain